MTRLALLLSLCVAIAVGACSSDAVPPPPKVPAGSLTPLSVPDAGVDTVTARERALPALYAAALSSAAGGGPPFAGLVPLLDADLAEFWSPLVATTHEPEGIV
ncbi:MAG: hypothetical protein JOZ69_19860, partial [Myxococcales bacterium]|nr:hypothetical protein [Myxococcales bacterium]